MPRIAAIVLLVLVPACGVPDDDVARATSLPGATPEQSTVARATARWEAAAHNDYVYVLNRGCTSCDQSLVGSFRITVRDAAVVMVERMPTRELVAIDNAPTIDDLLSAIALHVAEHPSAEATFDAEAGFPLQADLGIEDSLTIDFFSPG